jgi:hypothetical protein
MVSRRSRPPRRLLGLGPLLLAVVVQVLVVLVTVFVVVIGPIFEREPEFTAKKTIYLPQRELEHRVSMAEFQQAAQPPTMLNRLTVESLRPDAVPPLPSLPSLDVNPLRMDAPLLSADALLGQAGLLGGLGEVRGEASEFSFFGLKDRATRIVICFDVSQSVKSKVERAGLTMEAVKDETRRLVEQLNANTLFGFIQFSRQYDPFRPYLVAATRTNREAAVAWLEAEFRTDGRSGARWTREEPNGIQSVLRAAFRLDPSPNLVIIVSDGDFQRSLPGGGSQDVPWVELAEELRTLQAGLAAPAKVHFVGFQMKAAHKSELNRLARRFGGSVREID